MRYGATGASDCRPLYDIESVDEAIVNAVAHRDYSIYGAKIRLFLCADRLEPYSPGKLPNTMTLEEMPYRVFTRNPLLVNFPVPHLREADGPRLPRSRRSPLRPPPQVPTLR